MSESRVFSLNGMDVGAVVSRVEGFFRTEKGMEVQSSKTADGYVMQASQQKDGWKTISGTRLAITIQMAVFGNQLNVTIGEGQWSDKIGAGAIGLLSHGHLQLRQALVLINKRNYLKRFFVLSRILLFRVVVQLL